MAEKLSELFNELSEVAQEDESLEEQEQNKINDMKNASMDDWFYSQPILSHFDIEKKYAKEFNTNLSQARKELSIIVKKYEVEGNDIPTVIKQLKKYRRTLKGETKIEITNSIDNLIKAYSEHLSDSIDNIYWIKKYKSVLNNMVCSEDNIIKLSYVSEESTRREIIDVLCKYWENKLHMRDMPYSSDYAKLNKSMSVSKREFKSILRKYMNTTSTKDIIKHEILKAVCEDNGISSRQIHERLPKKLFNKTSPAIISKMAKSMDITSVDGAFYKLNDDIKKDIYAYTAAFIDSDGYITMDKNYNPRVGLIATGERGKAFMMEMHKSLGCGRLHLDQKSPQATRSVQRLNFYSGDDVVKLLTKCRPHFKMKGANADILLELVRMKKSHKKADWYKSRREELFQLMKYENHKDHVGYDFSQYGIDPTTVVKFHDNSKMFEMDRLEGIVV